MKKIISILLWITITINWIFVPKALASENYKITNHKYGYEYHIITEEKYSSKDFIKTLTKKGADGAMDAVRKNIGIEVPLVIAAPWLIPIIIGAGAGVGVELFMTKNDKKSKEIYLINKNQDKFINFDRNK